MILFTPVPAAVATPETALAAIAEPALRLAAALPNSGRKERAGFGLFMITGKANPMVQGHDKTNSHPHRRLDGSAPENHSIQTND